jgi:hypothetical protein
MKKLPFILIPCIVVLVLVSIVLVYKIIKTTASVNLTEFTASTTPVPTVTLTSGTAVDFAGELKNTIDDGGKSDLDALTQEAAGL